MKQLLRTLCVGIVACVMALAADVTGKWQAEFTTPDGTQRTATFNLKADGAGVTGTVAGGQDETPIKDGKVTGETISFTAERPFGTFTYTGKIAGDEIKFTVQFNDNSFEMVAKRAK